MLVTMVLWQQLLVVESGVNNMIMFTILFVGCLVMWYLIDKESKRIQKGKK